ncbi:hypothetical protein [Klebsiella pneumoniae]|uniref:hypothetical protein n=1 Tax=Klebsiella pneumoniae TaxID=573 RepID=UPI0011590CC8|nr:hypothetical protein [Klebsiella pneumoniae]ELA2648008.1 hypothetical protein [Klebsiella pneumoniae]MBX9273844.1 hypothetical protein [Klebsiella pneumoniae]MDM7480104.1 hypothetical protein [Klebsiella pneumoniae]
MRDPHYAGFFFLVAHCDNAAPQLFAEALVEGKPAGGVPEKRHCSMIKPASAGFIFYGEKLIQQENGGAKSELKPTKGQIGKIICNTIIHSLVMRFLYEDLPSSTT